MEKVLQILAVFVLLALVVHRFIRGREPVYQPFDYLTRLKPPLAAAISDRLLRAVMGSAEGDVILTDEARQLEFLYSAAGSLTIYWRTKEMQWLAAPLNCTAMGIDPEEGRLYLEAEGYWFVYGRSKSPTLPPTHSLSLL
ncbi:MAG TPA: hypothetical protein VHE34_17555 [Puia sp.]|uniref:hypothetical protein n=1 Tax=Puia sp. TaxID=2045100 RepID=UPI002C0EE438|nr:hypothetical protein [Puia sp.]HVU97043.1 hypothetical protein [Puia sp.]